MPPRGRKKNRVTTCNLLPYGRSEWKFDGGSTVPPKAGASRPLDKWLVCLKIATRTETMTSGFFREFTFTRTVVFDVVKVCAINARI